MPQHGWNQSLILSEASQKKTNIIWYHLYLESNIWHKWIFPQKRKSWTWRIDLWLPGGRGSECDVGRLGLIDANYCFWNELAMRSCCVALRTMSSHLWWSMIMGEKRMCTCMCNWVIMLYSRKEIVLGKQQWKKKRFFSPSEFKIPFYSIQGPQVKSSLVKAFSFLFRASWEIGKAGVWG